MSTVVKHELRTRLEGKGAVVGVVGLGYVGQPLALSFSESEYSVIGFDVDADKVRLINDGKTDISHIDESRIRAAIDRGFFATCDMARVEEVDALIICVPTPLGRHREPDLTYIVSTIDAMMPYIRAGQVISLESTTYPGCTRELIGEQLIQAGFEIGSDIFLVYSPEREDPGNSQYNTTSIPKVTGGATSHCLDIGVSLYASIIDQVVPVSSLEAAEMTKLLENIYRAVNIGLVNELKILSLKMGLDVREIIDAAATKPFGFTPFYPGPGLGGHCIPIDPFYLTWKAKEYDFPTRFIELAGEINRAMPRFVLERVREGLNDQKLSINGSRILIVGIAYKKNVEDMRESPAVEVMQMLSDEGALIDYHDPYVPKFPKMRRYSFDLSSIELTPSAIASYDAVVVTTDHDNIDWQNLRSNARIVIDTRGVFNGGEENVVKS